jgi:hypothetical protein
MIALVRSFALLLFPVAEAMERVRLVAYLWAGQRRRMAKASL